MIHKYPYTHYADSHALPPMGACWRCGVKLAFVNDSLQLLNRKNNVLSQVKIDVAQSAINDEFGNPIGLYFVQAGTRDKYIVLQRGNGDEVRFTVPYADRAGTDSEGNAITDYVKRVDVLNSDIRVTLGDGSAYSFTVPYAIKATTDADGKDITTYAASIANNGRELVLKDAKDRVISTVTVSYAENAANDGEGNNIAHTYANALEAGTTTIKLIAKDGTVLSEVTAPYAVIAKTDVNGNEFTHDYAHVLVATDDTIELKAHDGTVLATVTVPYATVSNHANNAIETITIEGDEIVFKTYDETTTRIKAPYAVKADTDKMGNQLTSYVKTATVDANGAIILMDAAGNRVATLVPTTRIASTDDYGNRIADYIKELVFDSQSDYLVATHGNGTVDTIVINYSNTAWKDTNDNIIKNVYVKTAAIEYDEDTEKPILVAYNGEGSEIWRLPLDIRSESATTDAEGNVFTEFYAHELTSADGKAQLKAPDGSTLSDVEVSATTDADNDDIRGKYAHAMTAQNGHIKLTAADDTELADVEVSASTDASGNEFEASYAASFESANGKGTLKSKDGSTLSDVELSATTDADGDNLAATYAASLGVDDTTGNVQLKAKDGSVLSEVSGVSVAMKQVGVGYGPKPPLYQNVIMVPTRQNQQSSGSVEYILLCPYNHIHTTVGTVNGQLVSSVTQGKFRAQYLLPLDGVNMPTSIASGATTNVRLGNIVRAVHSYDVTNSGYANLNATDGATLTLPATGLNSWDVRHVEVVYLTSNNTIKVYYDAPSTDIPDICTLAMDGNGSTLSIRNIASGYITGSAAHTPLLLVEVDWEFPASVGVAPNALLGCGDNRFYANAPDTADHAFDSLVYMQFDDTYLVANSVRFNYLRSEGLQARETNDPYITYDIIPSRESIINGNLIGIPRTVDGKRLSKPYYFVIGS